MGSPLNRFHYYPRLNPNPNTELPICVEPSPSPSVSPSPSPSISPSPSPSPVSRAFFVSCPVVPEFGDPQTDIVITDITNNNIISAELNSWFYIAVADFSGCAKISDLNPSLPSYEESPYTIGIYPAASPNIYTPYPSGEAPCLADHPCPS
jgi:hypothetical protein